VAGSGGEGDWFESVGEGWGGVGCAAEGEVEGGEVVLYLFC
jgi:hypothetical protein